MTNQSSNQSPSFEALKSFFYDLGPELEEFERNKTPQIKTAPKAQSPKPSPKPSKNKPPTSLAAFNWKTSGVWLK